MTEMIFVSPDIRMFLLMNNQIVIGNISESKSVLGPNGHYHIDRPAEVITKRSMHGPLGFALYPWLPNELLNDISARIPLSFIVTEMTPSNSIGRFYMNWSLEEIEKIQEFKEVFDRQILNLGEAYRKRGRETRETRRRTQSPIDNSLTDELVELFEEDNSWGDPSVTH